MPSSAGSTHFEKTDQRALNGRDSLVILYVAWRTLDDLENESRPTGVSGFFCNRTVVGVDAKEQALRPRKACEGLPLNADKDRISHLVGRQLGRAPGKVGLVGRFVFGGHVHLIGEFEVPAHAPISMSLLQHLQEAPARLD